MHQFGTTGPELLRIKIPGDPGNQGAAGAPSELNVTQAPASALRPEAPGSGKLPARRPALANSRPAAVRLCGREGGRSRALRDPRQRGSQRYAATARACRCAPTLRLTRCSALSTVLVSQPRRSPTCS